MGPRAGDAEGEGCHGADGLPDLRVQVQHVGLEVSNSKLSSLGGTL